MSFCVLAKENPFGDIVALEGEFVRTFLKDMPPEYVKLYVFCQYALSNEVRCSSISELASDCSLTVESVRAGLEYFSSEQLLRMASESPLAIEVRSVREAAERKNSELPEIMSGYSDYFAAVRSLVGRDMKPSEMEKAREWVEVYQLPEPVIMLMIQHCIINMRKSSKKTRNVFAYIDGVARSWAENGISTVEEAEYYLSVYELDHHEVNDVMLHIGIRRMPSVEEVKLYEKWIKDWGISHEAVIAACSETTKTANPSFAYLDKIIQGIYEGMLSGLKPQELLEATRDKRDEANIIFRTMGLPDRVTQEFLDIIQTAKLAGFDNAALLSIARLLARRAYKSAGSFEKEISVWAERGITTAEGIEQYGNKKKQNDERIKAIYAVCGVDAAVREADRKIYTELLEKGFASDSILSAADGCAGMRALKEKLMPQAKQTAAHSYDSHNSGQDDIFTGLDELEDA